MGANVVNLIVFAEQLAALAAKTVADVRGVMEGSSQKTTDAILADADATYAKIIANANTNTSIGISTGIGAGANINTIPTKETA